MTPQNPDPPVNNYTPIENPRPDSGERGRGPDESVNTHAEDHPGHTPASDQPTGRSDPSGSGTRGGQDDSGRGDVPADIGDSSPDGPGVDAIGPDNRYKMSGHGDYFEVNGTVRVPEGTSITTYAEHGSPITGALGNLIETGGDTSRVYSRTFYAGEEIPNYTLFPPRELNIIGTPHTVDRATLLSDLLGPNMGSVDFAACLGEWNNKVFDVDVIYDAVTSTPVHTYDRPIIHVDEYDDW